ncbi:MAG: hypothetical protein HYR60_12790 [Acidobacteria bacterium]|nr:hypothetical protein [Acidobacteriota bacterium]
MSRLTTAALALLLSGCAPGPVAYVAVREARFRSEVKAAVPLPLTSDSRERLLKFLRAGGDTDRIGSEDVEPDAAKRYLPLLDLLSDPANLALENLTEKGTFQRWFPGRRIRQVIDAREESPPALDPVAVTDGKYWWIFTHHQKKLSTLLVVKAIPRQIRR